MKKWFLSLGSKQKNICIGISLGLSCLCLFFVFFFTSRMESLRWFDYIFITFLVLSLIASMLFSIWKKSDLRKRRLNSATPQKKAAERMEFPYPQDKTFLFIDVETADENNDTVCSVGGMVVKNGITRHCSSLINPKVPITNTVIHGICDADVADAPTLERFWRKLVAEIGEDYVIVGHNIDFDVAVLAKDLQRYGISFFPQKKIDTIWVAKAVLYHYDTKPGDLKLDTICRKLHINLQHHNAESDIACTKRALEMLLTNGKQPIENFIKENRYIRKDTKIQDGRKNKTDSE